MVNRTPCSRADRRALAEARQRRDQQPLHAERRPVALRVLDQLVGFADPDRAAAALQPVVEQDAGDLPALAGAGAVAQEPAAAETNGILRIVARGRHDVKGRIDRPGAREKLGMRLAGIDDVSSWASDSMPSATTFAGRCGR